MHNYRYELRRWNQTAKECYMRGCICMGCPIYESIFKDHYSGHCKMKETVIELVRIFGITPDMKKINILEEK